MISTSVAAVAVPECHAFLEHPDLVRQAEVFAASKGYKWLRERSCFVLSEDGATVGLLTFRSRATDRCRGAVVVARRAVFEGSAPNPVLAPEFISDTLFAHLAEAFEHPDAFTAERFRVFPAIL